MTNQMRSSVNRRRDFTVNYKWKKKRIIQSVEEEVESKFGFNLFSEGDKRLGWLLTFTPDGGSFKSKYKFCPYFYAATKKKMETDVEAYLRQGYKGQIADIEILEKEDLDLRPQDFLECIVDLREYDVPYHVRFAIDHDLRCGQWYDVSVSSTGITLEKRKDLLQRAEVRICAFDIETTKLPLKFPDAEYDMIMMISYMFDGQGHLIINRECVGEDIENLEYTPKPEYEGFFKVNNVKNELELLRLWFGHMREVKPGIYVTYNGDYFDWPFLESRAAYHGLKMSCEVGFQCDKNLGECRSKFACHLDCIAWVKRDSYLPQGSHGLKAVTKVKLGYNPLEVNPEDMVRFAKEKPQMMASYSVSDAVATYYLYMTYVYPFIFSLATIIPMSPDEVLRKGSGTLCEMLLMVQAFKANVVCPNKHQSGAEKFHHNRLLESETYIGGHVECLESGVFRSDLPTSFRLDSSGYDQLINNLDRDLQYAIQVEGKMDLESVLNYSDVKNAIMEKLIRLRDEPMREECPLIYHFDVAAMYPNITLTNMLQDMVVLYDSLQLAHKCILNSFYGYVTRKGARWYSMEMAGVVTYTGAKIIQNARLLIEKIGKPLELDTDGIWCALPGSFPESFTFKTKDSNKLTISYPCVMLNVDVARNNTNDQYQTLVDPVRKIYETRSECSIEFEVDGPYKAELFDKFLHGSTLEECYSVVASVANRWLDLLDSQGNNIVDSELLDYISESSTMSKSLADYGEQKSCAVTTAKRLADFLGDTMVRYKGQRCQYIVASESKGTPVSERAVPVAIFETDPEIMKFYVRKWCKISLEVGIRSIIDWSYYKQRLSSAIQKIITIPAAMQKVSNPVPRVVHPDWLHKKVREKDDKFCQQKLFDMFASSSRCKYSENNGGASSSKHVMNGKNSYDIGDFQKKASSTNGSKPVVRSYDIRALKHSVTKDSQVDSMMHKKFKGVGCDPSSPFHFKDVDRNVDYHGWLEMKKRKWKSNLDKRKKQRSVDFWTPLPATDVSRELNCAVNDKEAPRITGILQLVHSSQSGQYFAWAVVEGVMLKIPVIIPRVFYINSKVPITEEFVGRRVNKTLPHGRHIYNLYEVVTDEGQFRTQSNKLAALLAEPEVEGIYESKIPLEFKSILQIGCVCKVKKTAKSWNIQDGWSLDELQMKTTTECSYLEKLIPFIYVYNSVFVLDKRKKMTKKVEERVEVVELEIASIKENLQRLPELEAKLTKHMERVNIQNEKSQQQQQMILNYIESMMKEQSTLMRESDGSSSKAKTKVREVFEEPKSNKKEDDEKNNDQNKFKKVEMLVFNDEDPYSWLFRMDRYF
ncbi:DNA polymerase epsilon catalytic subunit A-like [Cucumis melo var. makuwa]|uniref:DNA polymerase epsilon catalytic subunit n=1 Tax=Cucumis melo var. makuwa TaxID=1194695 RepID=A0A5D3C5I4_CUCMM|nr:DNA polymerase epsilon catalytic subunit A-like [Cucumis melo var. makuwa]